MPQCCKVPYFFGVIVDFDHSCAFLIFFKVKVQIGKSVNCTILLPSVNLTGNCAFPSFRPIN